MEFVRREPLDLQVPHRRLEAEHAEGVQILRDHGRHDGPIVIEIEPQRRATAVGVHVVEVLGHEGGIIDDRLGGHKRPRPRNVIDIARVMLVERHETDRRPRTQRNVDEAFGHIALAAVRDGVAFEIDRAAETG